jgi:hypothetical protein
MLAETLGGGTETAQLVQTVFGPPNQPDSYLMGDTDDADNAAAGYQDTKGFSANIMPALVKAGCAGWTRAHAVTQEFGTVKT